ncbi:sensor histidine kinase [Streptomyces subrutilus]|uniref:sensor histidine kinase n=1 Tax=Streptomyces subrutilus TaxID=36818 RepID=UPI0033E47ACD
MTRPGTPNGTDGADGTADTEGTAGAADPHGTVGAVGADGSRRPHGRSGRRGLRWLGVRRLGIRGRLFAGFAGALAVCAALMVTLIYVGIRFLPTYDIPVERVPGGAAEPAPGSLVPALPLHTPAKGSPYEGAATTKLVRTKQDVWAAVLGISTAGVLVIMTVGLGTGWIVSRRLLAPLHEVSEAAAKARDGDLAYRINAVGPDDELRRLADTFDAMLERLEESFAAHRRFAANASHELLTPLATTRAILQVAGEDSSGEELAELAPMLRETNERNIGVVKALLELAGAEHAAFDADPVDLAALVRQVVRDRAPAAAERAVTVRTHTEGDCPVAGNAALLRQLAVNLLDNAIGHNRADGEVRLAVLHDDGPVLEVENTGPIVAAEAAGRLFEPFYRARPRVGTGHGLGLAIVRSIAVAHHGSVTATARPRGGLTVRVRFPAR